MKLTTKLLKNLIKEELKSMNEATPHTKNQGVLTAYRVSQKYPNEKIRYYVYPVDVATEDKVEGFKGKGQVGHYRVVKDKNLYQAIANHYMNSAPNDVYVVGLENREVKDLLIQNNQIEEDRS